MPVEHAGGRANGHGPDSPATRSGTDAAQAELDRRRAAAEAMGGEQAIARHHASGRMTVRERVASLVQECTDDMNLPKAERRRLQVVNAPHKSPGAKLIKISDKISNIGARIHPDPSAEERDDLLDYTNWAEQVVAGCRGGNAWLDQAFDQTVKLARSSL